MDSKPITVAIADDHLLVRQMLVAEVNRFPGFKVVADAANGIELIEKLSALSFAPDLCLLDLSMPQMNGYETMPVLQKKWPGMTTLVLSIWESDFAVFNMIRRGARGYLHKGASTMEILHMALVSAHEKGNYYPGFDIAKTTRLFNSMQADLKEKELEFIKLSCSSLNYDEIAKRMNVSIHTVHGYRDRVFLKLDLKDRNALSLFAIMNGIVCMGDLELAQIIRRTA